MASFLVFFSIFTAIYPFQAKEDIYEVKPFELYLTVASFYYIRCTSPVFGFLNQRTVWHYNFATQNQSVYEKKTKM